MRSWYVKNLNDKRGARHLQLKCYGATHELPSHKIHTRSPCSVCGNVGQPLPEFEALTLNPNPYPPISSPPPHIITNPNPYPPISSPPIITNPNPYPPISSPPPPIITNPNPYPPISSPPNTFGRITADHYKHRIRGPRGKVLIVANSHQPGSKNYLAGVKRDGPELKRLFELLHYTVDLKENQTGDQMNELVRNLFLIEDHASSDSVIFIFSGHGTQWENKEYLFTADESHFPAQEVLRCASQSPSLKGKPKLFIFDSCRGGACRITTEPKRDQEEPDLFARPVTIFNDPTGQAVALDDCLLLYAAGPGFTAQDTYSFGYLLVDLFIDNKTRKLKRYYPDTFADVVQQVARKIPNEAQLPNLAPHAKYHFSVNPYDPLIKCRGCIGKGYRRSHFKLCSNFHPRCEECCPKDCTPCDNCGRHGRGVKCEMVGCTRIVGQDCHLRRCSESRCKRQICDRHAEYCESCNEYVCPVDMTNTRCSQLGCEVFLCTNCQDANLDDHDCALCGSCEGSMRTYPDYICPHCGGEVHDEHCRKDCPHL